MGLLPTHVPCLLRSVQAYTSSSIFLTSGMSSPLTAKKKFENRPTSYLGLWN
jgi:hypothetical protein